MRLVKTRTLRQAQGARPIINMWVFTRHQALDESAGLRYNSARAEVARRTGGPDPPVWLRLRVSRQEDGVLEVVNESAIKTA